MHWQSTRLRNAEERGRGLTLLQEAVDLSKQDMDDDGAHAKAGDTVDIFASRTRRAQLAPNVYELGHTDRTPGAYSSKASKYLSSRTYDQTPGNKLENLSI